VELYLPIAETSINLIYVIFIGIITGIVGGLFGVGGSFLGIPILTSYGIDTPVLIASYTHQMVATSFMSLPDDIKQKKINFKLVFLTFIGGGVGSISGSLLFKYLNITGHIEYVIAFIYIFVLGGISFLMLRESFGSIMAKYLPDHELTKKILESRNEPRQNKFLDFLHRMPYQVSVSDTRSISIYVIIFFGLTAGLLVSLAGISSGFIMIPLMIYFYKMNTRIAMSTSNIHGGCLVILSSLMQSLNSHAVDIVLSSILSISTAIGIKISRGFGSKIPPEEARIAMAIIMTILILRIVLNIVFEPANVLNVSLIH
jgi:uncharacterized membrane protein YfcA